MTAKATGKIVVTKIVGMNAPGHFHFRENIAKVNLGHTVGRLFDERTFAVVDFGVRTAIVGLNTFDYLFLCAFSIGVIRPKQFDGFLFPAPFQFDDLLTFVRLFSDCAPRHFSGDFRLFLKRKDFYGMLTLTET